MESTVPRVAVSADLADLVPRYLTNRQADLVFARQLLANQDFFMLAGMAHRIHGSASSYGFSGLGDIASAIEAAAEAGDADAVSAQLKALEHFLESVEIAYV